MIYRSFTLYDESGTAKSLNGEPEGSKLYFENPTGLGFNLAPTFANIGSGFFKNVSSDKIPQQNIVGDLIVSDYAEYSAFVRWVLKAKKLYFAYRPTPTSDEYRCEVAIDYLTKTEKNAGASLRCPISFKPLTPWYLEQVVEYEILAPTPPFTAAVYDVAFNTEGDLPSAMTIHAESSGTPYAITAKITGEAESVGHFTFQNVIDTAGVFDYSSLYNDSYIRYTSAGVESDIINNVDISNDPFFKLPANSNITVEILYNSTTAIPAKISLKLYNYYRSV